LDFVHYPRRFKKIFIADFRGFWLLLIKLPIWIARQLAKTKKTIQVEPGMLRWILCIIPADLRKFLSQILGDFDSAHKDADLDRKTIC
jgi:hypothetical protein